MPTFFARKTAKLPALFPGATQRHPPIHGKGFRSSERTAISQLMCLQQSLKIEDGYIEEHLLSGSLVADFLKQVDVCASMLKAAMTSRSYREKFTSNYRVILSSFERQYCSEIFVASMSRVSEGYMCVNGEMHPLTNQCLCRSSALRSSLLVLADLLDRLAGKSCSSNQDLPVTKQQLRVALSVFDDAWAHFEKEYVNTLIQIEANSRAPLLEAIELEQFIDTTSGFSPTRLASFLDCLSNLTAKVQLRHRRQDDTLQSEVLASASRLCHEHGNHVTAVLANGVVDSFCAVRTYLRMIEDQIDQAHPDLHKNPGLVEVLTSMRQNWKLFDLWGRRGPANDALNNVVAVARTAMVKMPKFKEMCESCDPELFLVLPRIVLLCFLNAPAKFQEVLQRFLPDHSLGVEAVCNSSDHDHPAKLPTIAKLPALSSTNDHEHQVEPPSSDRMQVLMEKFKSTTQKLRGAHPRLSLLDTTDSRGLILNQLIQRAILGKCDDSLAAASRHAASSTVDVFMLELEGCSHELQRHTPEVWNDFTALFVACIGSGLPNPLAESFRM